MKTKKKSAKAKRPSVKAKKVTAKQTLVSFVLDETGSMAVALDATISGYNEYVAELTKSPGKVFMTLTKFNAGKPNGTEVVYSAKPIKEVEPLTKATYKPSDNTPLYDAIGSAITSAEAEVKNLKGKTAVLLIVMTDGQENQSRTYDRAKVFELIEAKKKEGWTVAFLGADPDTWEVAQSLGITRGNTMRYDQNQTRGTFRNVAKSSVAYLGASSVQTATLFSNVDPKDMTNKK